MDGLRNAALLVTAALLCCANLTAAANQSGALSVYNLAVTPQPIASGGNATITFQLYNTYAGTLTNVNIWLSGSYPLLNYSPSNSTVLSSVGQGLLGGLFIYKIRIPNNTKAGTYTLYVDSSYNVQTTSGTSTPAQSSAPITMYISGRPRIEIDTEASPQISPGTLSTVKLTAINSGTDNATNVSITAMSTPDFSVVGSGTLNLDTVQPSDQKSGNIYIQPNDTLAQGLHYLQVRLSYLTPYGARTDKTVQLPISVAVLRPRIVASVIGATPQYLYPGSNQTLQVSLYNSGVGQARNVTVVAVPTPYIIIGSSSAETFFGSIAAGAGAIDTISITVLKNATASAMQLPLRISYRYANYRNGTTVLQPLNLTLQKTAIFNVTGVADSLAPGATYAPVTFTVTNRGNIAAQQVVISMQTVYPISTVNSNAYIGVLAPGEARQVTFYVNVDALGSAGQYPVTLYEQWTQPNAATSQQYTSSSNYFATVYSSSASAAAGNPYALAAIALVLVVAAGAAYTYVRRRGARAAQGQRP